MEDSNDPLAGDQSEERSQSLAKLADEAARARMQAVMASVQGTEGAAGHLDDAIGAICKLIELDPANVDRYLELGNVCKQRGLYDEAIAVYSEAIAIDPRCWIAYQNRGWIHALEDRPEPALRDCAEAISIHPSVTTRLARAEAYSLLEEYLPAIADCDEAVRLEPDNPACYAKRASLLSEWFCEAESPDLLRRAIEDHTTAIRLDPGDLQHRRNRGRDYLDLGCLEEAIEDLSHCVASEPDFYLNYEIRGEAYYQAGQPKLALSDLDRAIALNPDSSYAFEFRSKTHRMLGNLSKADADEQRWHELDPDFDDD